MDEHWALVCIEFDSQVAIYVTPQICENSKMQPFRTWCKNHGSH